MMRPLRLRTPLRGCRSGWQMPETRINTGALRVIRPIRVPKNFWAGKKAEYEFYHTATPVFGEFTFPQTFSTRSARSSPAAVRVSAFRLTRSIILSTRSARSGIEKTTTLMGKS